MSERASFQIVSNLQPTAGPQGLPLSLDFTASANISDSIAFEQQLGSFQFAQAVWVDNADNTKDLTLTFEGMPHRLFIKARRQGVYPVYYPSGGALRFRASSTGAIVVPIILLNVWQPYFERDCTPTP